MEHIFSSAPMFFGATRHSPATIRVLHEMTDPVDGEILKKAVEEARVRYPYFAVRAQLKDGWYELMDNPAPIPVRAGAQATVLGGEDVEGHLVAVRYADRRVCFDLFHGLTDAHGFMPFMQTVFYYYCTAKYGPIPRGKVLLKEDPISEEELLDPYPDEVDETIQPIGRYGIRETARLFPEGGKGAWYAIVQVPEDAFVGLSKQQDGSPATMTALLMARAVREVLGQTEKPIVCGLAIDLRPVLGKKRTHHSMASQLYLEYKKEMEEMSLTRQATIFRGMVILQSQPENGLVSIRNNIRFIKMLEKLPAFAARKAYMEAVIQRSMSASTFKVSYGGSHSMGPADPYVEAVYPFVDIHGAGAMLEVSSLNGQFYINFMQESEDERYLQAFLRQMKAAGIPATATEFTPYCVAGVDFEGV